MLLPQIKKRLLINRLFEKYKQKYTCKRGHFQLYQYDTRILYLFLNALLIYLKVDTCLEILILRELWEPGSVCGTQ
jgi:hypothetical protein